MVRFARTTSEHRQLQLHKLTKLCTYHLTAFSDLPQLYRHPAMHPFARAMYKQPVARSLLIKLFAKVPLHCCSNNNNNNLPRTIYRHLSVHLLYSAAMLMPPHWSPSRIYSFLRRLLNALGYALPSERSATAYTEFGPRFHPEQLLPCQMMSV